MSTDVFISYKSDEIGEALWVKYNLEKRGISCWMAPDCIPGGSSYAVEIPKAIKECKVFVLILSRRTQDSKWVPKEIDQAINYEKIIMPFMIEDFVLRDDFNFYLSNVQRYNAFESKEHTIEIMARRILQVVKRNTYSASPSYSVPPAKDKTTQSNPSHQSSHKELTPKNNRRLICLLLCIFLGWFGAHRYYAGRYFTGVIWTFSFGFFYIGWILDIIAILLGRFKDSKGNII